MDSSQNYFTNVMYKTAGCSPNLAIHEISISIEVYYSTHIAIPLCQGGREMEKQAQENHFDRQPWAVMLCDPSSNYNMRSPGAVTAPSGGRLRRSNGMRAGKGGGWTPVNTIAMPQENEQYHKRGKLTPHPTHHSMPPIIASSSSNPASPRTSKTSTLIGACCGP